jgi:hypothetical protein
MQEHLSLILAHFVIYLGCHLNLQITTEAELLLLSNSASRLLIDAPLQNPPLAPEIAELLSIGEAIPLSVQNEPLGVLDPTWISFQGGIQHNSHELFSTARTYSVNTHLHRMISITNKSTSTLPIQATTCQ